MRMQLAVARQPRCLTPQVYNQIFTMHGTTMIFLVVMPLLIGFVQLLRAADDRGARHGLPAPERAGLLAASSSAACCSTSASWPAARPTPAGSPTRRSPSKPYSATPGIDYWALGLLVTGIGTIGGAAST